MGVLDFEFFRVCLPEEDIDYRFFELYGTGSNDIFARTGPEAHGGCRSQTPSAEGPGTKTFSEQLTQAGIKNVYYESPGTAHEWLTWRRCFKEFAPLLFR